MLNATLNPGPDRGFIGVVDSGAERKTPIDCSSFGATVDLDVREPDFWISREPVVHEVVGFD